MTDRPPMMQPLTPEQLDRARKRCIDRLLAGPTGLPPKAKEHWEFAQRDRERHKFRDGGCACGLCELIKAMPEILRHAQNVAYIEGQSSVIESLEMFPCWSDPETGDHDFDLGEYTQPYVRPVLFAAIAEDLERNPSPYGVES